MYQLSRFFMVLFALAGLLLLFLCPFFKFLHDQFFVAILFVAVACTIATGLNAREAAEAEGNVKAGDSVKVAQPAEAEEKQRRRRRTSHEPNAMDSVVESTVTSYMVDPDDSVVEQHITESAGPMEVPLPESPYADLPPQESTEAGATHSDESRDQRPMPNGPRVRSGVKKQPHADWTNPVYRGRAK